jgi:hypothetical protein
LCNAIQQCCLLLSCNWFSCIRIFQIILRFIKAFTSCTLQLNKVSALSRQPYPLELQMECLIQLPPHYLHHLHHKNIWHHIIDAFYQLNHSRFEGLFI